MKELLVELGFSTNESTIYTSLLENGPLGPTAISRITGLNRSYLYDIIGKMVEKGYCSRIYVGKRVNIQATNPDQLAALLSTKAAAFLDLVPQLERLRSQEVTTRAEIFEGKNVHATLMKDILSTVGKKDDVLAIIADEKNLLRIQPILLDQYFREMKERGNKEYVIVKKGDEKSVSSVVETRELAEDLIGDSTTFVYGNRVAEIHLGQPYVMVVTENPSFAETKRKLFWYIWKTLAR